MRPLVFSLLLLAVYLNTSVVSTTELPRVRRQSIWDGVLNFFGQILGGAPQTGGGTNQYPGQYPGGYYPGGMYPSGGQYPQGGGLFPQGGGIQTGGNPAVGNNRVCRCPTKRTKRQAEDEDLDEEEDGLDMRIVGGVQTSQGQFPQTVIIKYNGNQHCGGTVVNEKYIMTAAHCVKDRTASQFTVSMGSVDMSRSTDFPVVRAAMHPQYNTGGSYNNDVAVLELATPITQFNAAVQPTCMGLHQRDYSGRTGIAVGWGKVAESGGASRMQRQVDVPVLSNQACSTMMNNRYTITDNMICAGYAEGGKDSCGGDSGGPLFLNGQYGYLQVGVTSFGEGCARRNRPGVYTRLDQVLPFLLDNMPNAAQCAIYSIDV